MKKISLNLVTDTTEENLLAIIKNLIIVNIHQSNNTTREVQVDIMVNEPSSEFEKQQKELLDIRKMYEARIYTHNEWLNMSRKIMGYPPIKNVEDY